MTLTEFLEARISEDGAAAQDNLWHEWTAVSGQVDARWWVDSPEVGHLYSTGYVGNGDSRPAAEHIARHDPARVLAECASRRAVLAECSQWYPTVRGGLAVCKDMAETILLALAVPYADHPDFDEAWSL